MTLTYLELFVIVSCFVIAFIIQYTRNKKILSLLEDNNLKTRRELNNKTSELASVRVKHGQAWEVFLPLMSRFEDKLGDKNDAIFLGQPIDLIYFKDDEIIFVEVKTGNSRLSKKQRRVRDLVKSGRVRWEEVNDDESNNSG